MTRLYEIGLGFAPVSDIRDVGCADTSCVAAYAAHTAAGPPRYVLRHIREGGYSEMTLTIIQGK